MNTHIMKIIAHINSFDRKISASLEKYFRIRRLVVSMKLISFAGSGLFLYPLYMIAFFVLKTQRPFVCLIITAEIVQLSIIICLRYLIQRPRPANLTKHYYSRWNSYSFPSLHTSRVFMLLIASSYYSTVFTPLMLLIAVSISFSRLILQKHYLSDIIVGAITGIVVSGSLISFLKMAFH